MALVRPFLKHLFYATHTTGALDRLIFLSAYLKNFPKNQLFKRKNKGLALPPAYYLYETYKLDYQQYISDGQITAAELLSEVANLFPGGPTNILDWGCGVGRTVRHLPSIASNANIYATDINPAMIEWNRKNIPGVSFELITDPYTLNYPDSGFDFVYAHSVLTHIHAQEQLSWIKEIWRVLIDGGIFVFSTHGRMYFDKILPFEKELLLTDGSYTKSIHKKGHRLMTSYNLEKVLRKQIEPWFKVLRFYDGADHPKKIGGQDLWVVRRRSAVY